MIRLPVFGQDSVPHASSRVLSLGATFIIWVVFAICAVYLGPAKEAEVKYEVVRLVLSPEDHYVPNVTQEMIDAVGGKMGGETEPVQEVADQSAPAVTEPVPVQTPVPAKTQTQPKQSTQKQPSPVPSVTKPAPVPDTSVKPNTTTSASSSSYTQSYATSVEDAFANQQNQKPKDYSNVDWDSMFSDSSSAQTSSSTTNKVTSSNNYSGAAASTGTTTSSNTASSSSSASTSNTQSASASTTSALSQMAAANGSQTTSTVQDRGTETSTMLSTSKNGAGQTQVEMDDGTTRTLLEPSTIAINFSAEASRSIDSDREITISFKVNENGNIYSIDVINGAGLSSVVISEIKAQIYKWRFESAANQSIANFKLKILKK